MANPTLSNEVRRALDVLARHSNGCVEEILLADGLSVGLVAGLVIDGLAIIEPIVTHVGGREMISVWLQITATGQKMIAEQIPLGVGGGDVRKAPCASSMQAPRPSVH
jgi:hypothetical protein